MKNELTKGINKRTEKKAELIASTIEKVVIGAAAIMWLVIMATSPAYAKDSATPTLDQVKSSILTNIAVNDTIDMSFKMADQAIFVQEQQRLAEEEAERVAAEEAKKKEIYDEIWACESATMTDELANEIYDYASEIDNKEARTACIFALSRVGYPYSQQYRNSGVFYDCSSLMYFSYEKAGIDLTYRQATAAAYEAEGLTLAGKEINIQDIQPGDLIFYSSHESGRYLNITHVAMYVGNGKIVHARDEKYGVMISDADFHQDKIVAVCRPWNAEEEDAVNALSE